MDLKAGVREAVVLDDCAIVASDLPEVLRELRRRLPAPLGSMARLLRWA